MLRRALSMLLPLLLLAALACEEAPPPKLRGTPVVLSSVELRDLVERIEAPGELLAKNRAVIAAEVAGQVTEISADEGASVEPGAIVIEIDPERRRLEIADARARVAETQASLTERKRELARMRKLRKREVASSAQLESAETALETADSRVLAARASLGVAERALRDSSVAAPFGGLVAMRYVHRGEYVQPGQPLFELVSLDPIEVEFHLAEVDSARVALGQEVDVRVLPAAIGVGPGAESRQPMAVATAAGMFSSTALTLVVVPVFYLVLDDAVAGLKGLLTGSRKAAPRAAMPPAAGGGN